MADIVASLHAFAGQFTTTSHDQSSLKSSVSGKPGQSQDLQANNRSRSDKAPIKGAFPGGQVAAIGKEAFL
jgi:hypothetical protein